MREIAKTVGVSKSTIERWLWDYDRPKTVDRVSGQCRNPDGENTTLKVFLRPGVLGLSHNSIY